MGVCVGDMVVSVWMSDEWNAVVLRLPCDRVSSDEISYLSVVKRYDEVLSKKICWNWSSSLACCLLDHN